MGQDNLYEMDAGVELSGQRWMEEQKGRGELEHLPELVILSGKAVDKASMCQTPPIGCDLNSHCGPGEGIYAVETRVHYAGGYGEIYKGYDKRRNRFVAVKKAISFGPEDVSDYAPLFLLEARIMSKLNHPNIAQVYDVTMRGNGEPVMIMEWLGGVRWGSLRDLLSEGRLSKPEEILGVIGQIASATDYLASMGLRHRDLKPTNVMVDREDGIVKLVDFGSSSWADGFIEKFELTPWTELYASPELLNGQVVDERSDIYQLGLIAYEMLTGRRYKEMLDVEYKWGDKSLLTKRMKRVLKKVLQPDPSRRHTSAMDFFEELKKVLV